MKLRTFHVLCYLCVLCTFVLAERIDWENQSVSAQSGSSNVQEAREALNANNPRDKRALGLILSGLAQVFGYTVSPVQIASLPNPSPESNEARSAQSPGNNSQTPSTTASSSNPNQTNGSSTMATPAQRETIRFTGVVNFGNGTGLLTQLQQYESVFHGGNNSMSSMTPGPPSMMSSSMSPPPQPDVRTPSTSQPLLPPLLVKIPLPTISEQPLPAMPQAPLPEIPPQDINLTYPEPLIPIRKQQQVVYRKNASSERLTLESMPIYDGKDVQSPPPPPPSTMFVSYTEEPRWKQEYEDRLAELERKQEEHAKRLREQEWYRNRQKEDNDSGEEDKKEYSGPEKQVAHGGQDSDCRKEQEDQDKSKQTSQEEDESSEKYQSGERIREHSADNNAPQKMKESEESGEEEKSYRDYKNDDAYRYKEYEDSPQTSENYTNVQYSEPLPLSDDDEQRRPEELRNSYGELLYNREPFDTGFVSFFGKFKQPLSDLYSSSVPPDSREETSKEEEDSRGNQKDEDKSGEGSREEDTPARNKYEEYSLEENTDTRRKDDKESNEDVSQPMMKQASNVSTNGENKSFFEERKMTEELDFTKYMPFVVPVRYLSAPEELKKAKSRLSSAEKSEKDNVLRAEASKKILSKESRPSRKENLKPVIGFPERHTPRKLHEGEQKVTQMWPPPFEFVLDSTIHTNVVPARINHNDDIKVPNIRRKPESSNKRKEEKQQQNGSQVTLDKSTQKPYEHPDFQNGFEYGTVTGKKLMLDRPINAEKFNQTGFEMETTKFDKNVRKEEYPDFWERYKYTSNNNYRNTERPNIEIQHSTEQQVPSSQYSKKFESLKRSIEKNEPIVENKMQANVQNSVMPNVPVAQVQNYEPMIPFDPTRSYNFFDFGENVYGLDYGRGNERISGVFDGDKKIENGEVVSLAMPQQDVYRYDESLTKFISEPESKNEKVADRDYGNGVTTVRVIEQEQIPNGPISYIDYSRIL